MEPPSHSRKGDLLPLLVMVAGAVLLGFLVGAVIMEARWPPYQLVHGALYAAKSLHASRTGYVDVYKTNLWRKAASSETGVVRRDGARMNPGLTLFTSSHSPVALLVDSHGTVVHQWHVPPELVTGARERDPFTYLRKAHLFPNGDLLTFFEKVNATPWGIALVRVTKDGKLLWSYKRPIHHDFDVGPDGRIYALDTTVIKEPFSGLKPEYFPLLDDDVVVLDESGHELMRVSITKALLRSPFARLVQLFNPRWKGDLLHTNGVELVTDALAKSFPFLEAGHVVVSIREANMIAAIDLQKKEVSWATHGYWLRQHDVDMLENGHFMLFDNLGNFGPGGVSRVIEFDPRTMAIEWQYAGSDLEPFGSKIRAAQSRLPNGNTLITESDAGRLLEVTPNGEVVWEYRSPWRAGVHNEMTSILSWAERVDVRALDRDFAKDIMPSQDVSD